MVLINIFFYISGVDTGLTTIVNFITGDIGTGEVEIAPGFMTLVIGVAVGSAVTAGFFGSSAGTIGLATAGATLVTFGTMPISIINSTTIGIELKLLIGGVLGVMYVLALLSFLRGSDF
jgi:hypothetical protein